jgi:hypothetical protein
MALAVDGEGIAVLSVDVDYQQPCATTCVFRRGLGRKGVAGGEEVGGKSDPGGPGTSITAVPVHISHACGEETVSGMGGIVFGRREKESD